MPKDFDSRIMCFPSFRGPEVTNRELDVRFSISKRSTMVSWRRRGVRIFKTRQHCIDGAYVSPRSSVSSKQIKEALMGAVVSERHTTKYEEVWSRLIWQTWSPRSSRKPHLKKRMSLLAYLRSQKLYDLTYVNCVVSILYKAGAIGWHGLCEIRTFLILLKDRSQEPMLFRGSCMELKKAYDGYMAALRVDKP
jgi:hypothetical protein